MENIKTILISFSGGRASAFMAKWILESDKYKDYNKVAVYANTGKEREETLEFIDECDKRWNLGVVWIEAVINKERGRGSGYKVVDFSTANRDGSLFEEMISVYGIPNTNFPHCNRELKKVPIHKYMKDNVCKDYYTAIGIRADESHRINWEVANKEKWVYPLATEFRVSSLYIRKFWENQCFDLSLKDYEGNCDMCWKKSNRNLFTLINEKPELIDWWNEMEIKYGGDDGFTFFRGNKSAVDIIEMSKRPFRKAVDKLETANKQSTLFDINFDQEESCMCG